MKERESDGFSKVPQVTLLFWVIKVLATTLGETLGDTLSMSFSMGYLSSSLVFMVLFLVALSFQVFRDRLHLAVYWFAIIATTTLGTTLADFADRTLGVGYAGGAAILLALLVISLLAWRLAVGQISVHPAGRREEWFYWVTIMFSQTLGTALGDWSADPEGLGLGYETASMIFAAGLAVVCVAYRFSRVSRVTLFWMAFVLTRPLGAVVGDLLDKPLEQGGMALSRTGASVVLLAVIVVLVTVQWCRGRRTMTIRSAR